MHDPSRVPYSSPHLRSPEAALRRPTRLSRIVTLVLAAFIVAGVGGFFGVWTNTLGLGTKWEHVLARIDLALNPPPDRDTVPTVDMTPAPLHASPVASAPAVAVASASPKPGSSPGPAPKPTPTPAPPRRVPVSVSVVKNPKAIFEHEDQVDMCAAAGVQMVLLAHGQGDASVAFQHTLMDRVGEWDSYRDSHNGKWGPSAMVKALAAYGVDGYQVRAYKSRADALLDAARAISTTGAPAILMAWRGAHTWVMSGYKADADPMLFDSVTITGAYILDPWYPDWSSIWGQSDPPGTFQDASEMIRNFLPWHRPEGSYADRDGKFIVVVPTKPLAGG